MPLSGDIRVSKRANLHCTIPEDICWTYLTRVFLPLGSSLLQGEDSHPRVVVRDDLLKDLTDQETNISLANDAARLAITLLIRLIERNDNVVRPVLENSYVFTKRLID